MPAALPDTLVFILGCQRSGTTWLANIFDASADVLLFMEPFSPPYGIFPEFPDPWEFVDGATPSQRQLLREAMPERLMRHKSLLFRRSATDPGWYRRERGIAEAVRRVFPPSLRRGVDRFTLLNLNRLDENFPLYPKSPRPRAWVIKELRFAGKVPLVVEALPEARLVVIVRHPCATVDSILSWFERGGLGELRGQLETFLDRLEAQPVGEHYRSEIARCRDGGLAQTVALYWRVSYETMAGQIEGRAGAELLVYEQLASRPRDTATGLFERLGIPWSEQLDGYMTHSTSARGEAKGPTNTRRDSTTYYQSWKGKISARVRDAVLDITGESALMKLFDPYYDEG